MIFFLGQKFLCLSLFPISPKMLCFVVKSFLSLRVCCDFLAALPQIIGFVCEADVKKVEETCREEGFDVWFEQLVTDDRITK